MKKQVFQEKPLKVISLYMIKYCQIRSNLFEINCHLKSIEIAIRPHLFLKAEYCDLCTTLPSVSIELGLKSAEIIKFYNSRICQLILGVAAISVSGLKTITIRNLALAKQSLQVQSSSRCKSGQALGTTIQKSFFTNKENILNKSRNNLSFMKHRSVIYRLLILSQNPALN